MPVSIHNKEYFTVAERIDQFRKDHPGDSIVTELIGYEGNNVIVKAVIKDSEGRVIATGHAEEVRGSTMINKTSALENAETSAVGRALAFFGLAGTEIASADEVANAISQQAGGTGTGSKPVAASQPPPSPAPSRSDGLMSEAQWKAICNIGRAFHMKNSEIENMVDWLAGQMECSNRSWQIAKELIPAKNFKKVMETWKAVRDEAKAQTKDGGDTSSEII